MGGIPWFKWCGSGVTMSLKDVLALVWEKTALMVVAVQGAPVTKKFCESGDRTS